MGPDCSPPQEPSDTDSAAVRAVRDEAGAAWLLFVYLMLLTFGIAVGRSVGASLFLGQCGARELAYAYILVSICVSLVIYVVSGVTFWLRAYRVALVTVVVLTGLAILFRFLLVDSGRWMRFTFYVLVELGVTLTTVQFWAISNTHFSFAQARRRYAFIVTGGTLGAILGGGFTLVVMRFHCIDTLDLLWVLVLLAPAGFGLLGLYAKRYGNHVAPAGNGTAISGDFDLGSPVQTGARGFVRSLRHPVLRTRPGLSLMVKLAGTALMTVFATTLIDFQFKLSAKAALPDTQDLTAFFGLFYLAVGVTTLLVQVLGTPALTRSGRMFRGLALTPFLLALVTIGNLVVPVFPWTQVAIAVFVAMCVLKVLDSALSHSINRSCREMVYTCLPEHLAGGFKALAEGVSGRVGLGLAGLALLLLAPGATSLAGLLLTLGLLVAWFGSVAWLRHRFHDRVAAMQDARR